MLVRHFLLLLSYCAIKLLICYRKEDTTMKINNLTGVMKAYQNQNRVQPGKDVKSSKGEPDAMSVSKEAKTFSAVFQAVKKAPDVREDKIAALKEAIAGNQYQVDDEKLVDRIIERMQGPGARRF